MRTLSIIALLLTLSVVGAGCGDDDDSDAGSSGASTSTTEKKSGGYGSGGASDNGGGGTAQELKMEADPGGALKFIPESLTAKAGKVKLVMDNPSSLPHAVELEGNGVEEVGETVEKGGVSEVTASVEPGEYEYYCPVGGHKAAGMTGTLTVE